MVCTLGRGRMASILRLLPVGNLPELTSDDIYWGKIATETIQRVFNGADEPNLLEEEDMHVFDSRPLTDPLFLVCCNACKKPMKASQYAAHAERCSASNIVEDTDMELTGDTEYMKSPQRERMHLDGANHNNGMISGEQGNSESTDGSVVSGLKSSYDDQRGGIPSQSKKAQNGSAPLATKIYYSQGNNRLRLSLGYLYHEASGGVHDHDSRSTELIQDNNVLSSKVPYLCKSSDDAHRDGTNKEILAQSSELVFGTSRVLPLAMNSSNTLKQSNILKPGLQAANAPVGMTTTRFHSAPHSFSGTTGRGGKAGITSISLHGSNSIDFW